MSQQKLALEQSRAKAQAFWNKCKPTTSHAYAVKKGVTIDRERVYDDLLLIPGLDADNEICTVQMIQPDGTKRFLKGCKAKGVHYFIGKPVDGVLYICEGWATGKTIHAATSHAVAVAFSSVFFKEIARIMREKFPDITLVIAADNDKNCNAIKKAEEAALQYDAWVVFPEFADD